MDTTPENILHLKPPLVHHWQHELFEEAGIAVDVLRLDVMNPTIGGNKWMKLKGFLERVITDGKAGIFTKGGPWSNHIHACAWLCQHLGNACTIWVKGNNRTSNSMLDDVANWNATIRFINRSDFYSEEKATRFAVENNLLYIPMGGADETGVQHVSQFIQLLYLPVYDFAICAVGTATTFGGFALIPGNFKNVIGIDVGTGDDAVKQKIAAWRQSLPGKNLSLIPGYDFGGFARHTPELVLFMNELYKDHQIPTDIVYTGKLFYAAQHLTTKNYFVAGSKLLIVHSGGLQGNRSLPAGTLQF